jgi:hypothetical protein
MIWSWIMNHDAWGLLEKRSLTFSLVSEKRELSELKPPQLRLRLNINNSLLRFPTINKYYYYVLVEASNSQQERCSHLSLSSGQRVDSLPSYSYLLLLLHYLGYQPTMYTYITHYVIGSYIELQKYNWGKLTEKDIQGRSTRICVSLKAALAETRSEEVKWRT